MFGKNDTRHIDLHLPQSWNRCTTEELEAIAAAIITEQQRVDRYHPFDWQRVKLCVVLAVNSMAVVEDGSGLRVHGSGSYQPSSISHQPSDISPQPSDIESTWLVQRPEDKEPWPITTGQLLALTEQLAWIDDEKASKLIFRFPYMEMTLAQGSKSKVQGSGFMVHGSKRKAQGSKPSTINRDCNATLSKREPLTVVGPPPLLDGYTWKEYRWLTDWMQEYIRCNNATERLTTDTEREQNQAALDRARNEFLAIMFKPAGKPTGTVPSDSFADFSSVKWQVVLFWWSSLMQQLSGKFPKVFHSSNIGKKRKPRGNSPWDFYNLVTATIQKYIGGLSAHDVDGQPYGVVLQQLEMMAEEAAEMEKLRHKK